MWTCDTEAGHGFRTGVSHPPGHRTMLKRSWRSMQGWELAERYMPGMQAAMEAAGAIRFNIITEGKEVRNITVIVNGIRS